MTRPYTRRSSLSHPAKEARQPVLPPDPDMAAPAFTPQELSDADLGIGEDAQGGALDLQSLVDNPALAQLIEGIVEQRLRQAGAPIPAPTGSEAAFNAFLSKFDHMLEVQAEQRPGYIKPLSADEVDARNKGRADMLALLRQYKAEDVWPHYLIVGDGPGATFYGPSPNGPILYEAGQEIKTRLAPSELFQPLNEPAARVMQAYRRWVGEVVSVEDLIAEAAATARGAPNAPQIELEAKTLEPEVVLVDAPKRDVTPKRTMGTIIPELRGKSMPRQPGVAAEPVGPIFVDAT